MVSSYFRANILVFATIHDLSKSNLTCDFSLLIYRHDHLQAYRIESSEAHLINFFSAVSRNNQWGCQTFAARNKLKIKWDKLSDRVLFDDIAPGQERMPVAHRPNSAVISAAELKNIRSQLSMGKQNNSQVSVI